MSPSRLRFALVGLAVALMLLAGCESASFSERLRDRFAAVPPQTHVVPGEPRAAYFAAQLAFNRLDYALVRSDLSDLRVEAASRINTSAAFADARQIVAEVRLAGLGPKEVEVSLRLVEQVESRGAAGVGGRALREHGFYSTYFAVLEDVLREQATAPAPKKD